MSWFRVHRDGEKATLNIFDQIGFACDASECLAELHGATSVELVINSHGGCARTAEALIESLKGRTPLATIIGVAASSAVLIAQAAERILIHPNANMMLHAPSACDFANAQGLRATADWLDRWTGARVDMLCDRTGQPVETVCRWMDGKDHWFTAQEAIAAGLADAILEPPKRAVSRAAVKMPRREARKIPVEMPLELPSLADEAHEQERLLMDVLRALGTVKTTDRKKLFRELSQWFALHIQQIEDFSPARLETGAVAPRGAQGAGTCAAPFLT